MQNTTTTTPAAAAALLALYNSIELFKAEALGAARRFALPGWNIEAHLDGVFGEVPLRTGAKIRRSWDRYYLERVGRREDRTVFEVTNWLTLSARDIERRQLLTAVIEYDVLGGTRTTRQRIEQHAKLCDEQGAIREERRHRRSYERYQRDMELWADEQANWVPGLGDMGGELADLSAALKFNAVTGDLTDIRRTNSGDAYADHGRTTVRTKPAKTAANRSARRAVNEALRRVLDGDDVQDVAQRVGKTRFQYRYPGDPVRLARHEENAEISRRIRVEREAKEAAMAAWKLATAEWHATYKQLTQTKGWQAAAAWGLENPLPTRPLV